MQTIPDVIMDRMVQFRWEVEKYFSFLFDHGYQLESDSGRTKNFLDYFYEITFVKEDTRIMINYSTDIVNGHTIAFPTIKERPITDNSIFCSVIDKNALLIVDLYREWFVPLSPKIDFWIGLYVADLKADIGRVVRNYSAFFQDHLMDVIEKKKMYMCTTDRHGDGDRIFEEFVY